MATAATHPLPTDHPHNRLLDTWQLLREAAANWSKDNAIRLSAAVAMYGILSLAPLLVISIKVMSVVLNEDVASRQVNAQVHAFLGPKGAAAVEDMVAAASKPGSGIVPTLISLAVLVYTASGVFNELRDSLNAIWGVRTKPNAGIWATVRNQLLSIGMVFAVGFLLLVTQVVTTAMTAMSRWLGGDTGWIPIVIDLVASPIVVTLLFALIFRFLPDTRVGWRYVWGGAFATAVLFKVGQYLQALYFTYISTGSVYGAAGSFVVVMMWVYYSCWILFFGAEMIGVTARRHGRRIEPTSLAEPIDQASCPSAADAVRAPNPA